MTPQDRQKIYAMFPQMQGYDDSQIPFSAMEQAGVSGGTGGGGGAVNFEDPASVAAFTRVPGFDLPDSAGAMGRLRNLQTSGTSGLEALLAEDLEPGRQKIEDALYSRMEGDIDRMGADSVQQILENTFARGVGPSTVTGDYYVAPLRREQATAKENARLSAFTTSGGEARANQGSRLAALGQAFNQGTTGLQGEANVGMANADRERTTRTGAATTGLSALQSRLAREQQGSQFSQSLAQQEKLQQDAFKNAEKIASENRLASGVAGGLGGLANLFGPTLNNLMQKIPGLG